MAHFMILRNLQGNAEQPEHRPNPVNQIRLFRPRVNELDIVSPREFFQATRLYPYQYRELHSMLEPYLTPTIPTNKAISSNTRLQAALCYLASGDNLRSSARGYGMSNASQSRHLNSTLNAIIAELNNFIRYPTPVECRQYMRENEEVAGFPGVLGMIDGTHIKIGRIPATLTHVYNHRQNSKDTTLNIMAVCNSERLFWNVLAKYPGAHHDNFVFSQSQLYRDMENQRLQGILLGDSGYGIKPWIMTPFLNPVEAHQIAFNRAHKKTRFLVENAFGDLKNRWRCLHRQGGELYFEPAKCCRVVVACFALHNFCVRAGVPLPGDEVEAQALPERVEGGAIEDQPGGARVRERIALQHFG